MSLADLERFALLSGWTATICSRCGHAEIRPPERLLGWSGTCGQWVPDNREPTMRSPTDRLRPYRPDRVWCGGKNQLHDLTFPLTARAHTVAEYALKQARAAWDAQARRQAHQEASRRGSHLRALLRAARGA